MATTMTAITTIIICNMKVLVHWKRGAWEKSMSTTTAENGTTTIQMENRVCVCVFFFHHFQMHKQRTEQIRISHLMHIYYVNMYILDYIDCVCRTLTPKEFKNVPRSVRAAFIFKINYDNNENEPTTLRFDCLHSILSSISIALLIFISF